MPLKVWDLQFDDENEAEFGRHHVSAIEILQVLDNAPVFFRNRKKAPRHDSDGRSDRRWSDAHGASGASPC